MSRNIARIVMGIIVAVMGGVIAVRNPLLGFVQIVAGALLVGLAAWKISTREG